MEPLLARVCVCQLSLSLPARHSLTIRSSCSVTSGNQVVGHHLAVGGEEDTPEGCKGLAGSNQPAAELRTAEEDKETRTLVETPGDDMAAHSRTERARRWAAPRRPVRCRTERTRC